MKNQNKNLPGKQMTLGDLVGAVVSYAHNNREAVASLVDLLESGRVRLKTDGKFRRVHICRR